MNPEIVFAILVKEAMLRGLVNAVAHPGGGMSLGPAPRQQTGGMTLGAPPPKPAGGMSFGQQQMGSKTAGAAEAAAIMEKLKASAKPRTQIAVPGTGGSGLRVHQQEMGEAPGYHELPTNQAGIKARATADAAKSRASQVASNIKKAPQASNALALARRLGGR